MVYYTKKHRPCGHWHKLGGGGPNGPSDVGDFEVYFELLNGMIAIPEFGPSNHSPDYAYASTSFIPIDPSDFDGTVTWEFEVIAFNNYDFDVVVSVINSSGDVCGAVTIAAGTIGADGVELFRQRVSMTPNGTSYGVKVTKAIGETLSSYPLDLVISVARVIITQSDATKTKIQIPMFGSSYNYNFQGDSPAGDEREPYDTPIGYSLSGLASYSDLSEGIYKNVSKWELLSGELSTISNALFSVYAKPVTYNTKLHRSVRVVATTSISSFRLMLYRTTSTATGACTTGTPIDWGGDTQVYTDGCTCAVFTPIPDSLASWDGTPASYSFNLTPDFSGLSGTLNIFIGGIINGGPWGHFTRWFQVSVPAGYQLSNCTLTVTYVSALSMDFVLEYDILNLSGLASLYACLWDETANSMVDGSLLEWEPDEVDSRKSAEVTLVSGHTYRPGFMWSILASMSSYLYPEVMDAQLLIKIDPISALTTWLRCLHSFIGLSDNYDVPADWGPDYWSSGGGNCVTPRVHLGFLGTTQYFEASGYVDGYYPEDPNSYTVSLIDLGEDGYSGDSGGVSAVSGGQLIWVSGDEGTIAKKRSGALSLVVGRDYCNYQAMGEAYYLTVSNGFIVTRIA